MAHSSVQFSRSVVSNSLQPHGLQQTRPPCPSLTPGVYSNSSPLCRWCHPTISSSVNHFSSCLQSFPASESFQMSQFFASGGQSISFSFNLSPSKMCTSLSSFVSVMPHWKFDCSENTDKFRNLCCKVELFPPESQLLKHIPKHTAYYHQPPQDIHFYHQSNYFMFFQVNPLATTLNFNYYLLIFLILNFIRMESYRMFTFVSGFFI